MANWNKNINTANTATAVKASSDAVSIVNPQVTDAVKNPNTETPKNPETPKNGLCAISPAFIPDHNEYGAYLLKCNLTKQFGDNVWRNGGTFVREETILVKTGIKYNEALYKKIHFVKGLSTNAVNNGLIVNSATIEMDGELCVMIHVFDFRIKILQGDVIAELIVL